MSSELCPLVIMDERERGEIRDIIEKFPVMLQIETLPVGDYILSKDFVIERKRGDDLVASLCDNRLFSQIHQLKTYYRRPMILLENSKTLFDRLGVLEQSIYGAMMYCIYKENIPILPSRSSYESAQMIWSFAKYIQKDTIFQYKHLEINEEQSLRSIQLHFLQGLFETSEKKAITLLDAFETPWNVIQAIVNSEITATKSGNLIIKHSSFKELNGFGVKYLIQNQKLLKMPFCLSPTIKRKDFKSFILPK